MVNFTYGLISVLIMALVTYIMRALPICIFRKKITSKYFNSFLAYVPYAVLGSLTFPDIFYSTGKLYSAIVGTAVALILSFKGKSLVVVAVGAVIAVALSTLLHDYVLVNVFAMV